MPTNQRKLQQCFKVRAEDHVLRTQRTKGSRASMDRRHFQAKLYTHSRVVKSSLTDEPASLAHQWMRAVAQRPERPLGRVPAPGLALLAQRRTRGAPAAPGPALLLDGGTHLSSRLRGREQVAERLGETPRRLEQVFARLLLLLQRRQHLHVLRKLAHVTRTETTTTLTRSGKRYDIRVANIAESTPKRDAWRVSGLCSSSRIGTLLREINAFLLLTNHLIITANWRSGPPAVGMLCTQCLPVK